MSDKKRADELLKDAYSKYYSDVYRFCMSYLTRDKSSIDDCVQEAFIVLYKKYLSGEDVTYVKTFLYKTVSNCAKMKLRDIAKAQKHVSLDEVIHLPSQNEDMTEKLTFDEYSRQISAALSDQDAELFRLRFIEDYSLKEIAEMQKVNMSTIGTRVNRLHKKLITISKEILSLE
ncbi:MAG: RNA polymerase sigma factor [Eubacterium sp.]